MKVIHRKKLAELGITSKSYCDQEPWPPRWGITLDGPRSKMVVDNTPKSADGDGKYHLRPARGSNESYGAFKTQREAIAGYIAMTYL
jgi:hypothetical protein